MNAQFSGDFVFPFFNLIKQVNLQHFNSWGGSECKKYYIFPDVIC